MFLFGFKTIRFLPVLFVVLLSCGRAESGSVSNAIAEWTILVYHDADCDLEEPMIEDLVEMTQAPGNSSVNVVLLVDRAEGDDPELGYSSAEVAHLGDWTTAKWLRISGGEILELEDRGEVNMGDPETLREFITSSLARFPAKKIGIVLGNHGMAWPGACSDDSHDDELTLEELRAAFAGSAPPGGFELIGFDCCLMASLEVAATLAPFGRFLVASEELEPGTGWDYAAWLGALSGDPRMNGAELGRKIADSYFLSYAEAEDPEMANEAAGVTLSVVDLARVPAVREALAACGTLLASAVGDEENWLRIAREHRWTEEYGTSGDPNELGAQVFDLVHLAENLQQAFPSGRIFDAAGSLERAARAAVVHTVRGESRPNANGLSVYMPRDPASRDEIRDYSRIGFSGRHSWTGFVDEYFRRIESDNEPPSIASVRLSADRLNPGGSVTVRSRSLSKDLADAYFVLSESYEGEDVLIGQIPVAPDERGELVYEWDGGWFHLSDAEKSLICPITEFDPVDEEKGKYFVAVPAEFRPSRTRDWVEISIFIDLTITESGITGSPVYAFRESDNGPVQVSFRPGSQVRPVYVLIDENGDESLVVSDDPDDFLEVGRLSDIGVTYETVTPAGYNVGFLAFDFADNGVEHLEFLEVL